MTLMNEAEFLHKWDEVCEETKEDVVNRYFAKKYSE